MLEETVPQVDRLKEVYEGKWAKYQTLIEDCHRRGWKTNCLPIEVGSR